MTKTIRSATDKLARALDEIGKLREQNSQLNIQNVVLRRRLAKYEKVGDQKPRRLTSEAADVAKSRAEASLCRYQQPTVASENRSNRHKQDTDLTSRHIVTIHGKAYEYDDGAIVAGSFKIDPRFFNSEGKPRYQVSTCSTRGRAAGCIHWYEPRRRTAEASTYSGDSGGDGDSTPDSEGWGGGGSAGVTTEAHGDADRRQSSLEARSRLRDGEWVGGPFWEVGISSKMWHGMLCQAFRLAQATFYDAAQEHWPDLCRWGRLQEGPHEVLFGHAELRKLLGGYEYYHRDFLAVRGSSAYDVNSALFKMTPVRNAVCHFWTNTCSSVPSYDHPLAACQRLAVVLQDEKRAFKIRAIRDRLRREVDRALEEIDSLKFFAVLPYARPWKCHLGNNIVRALRYKDWNGSYDDQLPAIIRTAADIWSWSAHDY